MQQDQGRVQSALLHQSSHTPPEFTPHHPARSPLNPKNFLVLFIFVYSVSVKNSALLQEAVGASLEEKV